MESFQKDLKNSLLIRNAFKDLCENIAKLSDSVLGLLEQVGERFPSSKYIYKFLNIQSLMSGLQRSKLALVPVLNGSVEVNTKGGRTMSFLTTEGWNKHKSALVTKRLLALCVTDLQGVTHNA